MPEYGVRVTLVTSVTRTGARSRRYLGIPIIFRTWTCAWARSSATRVTSSGGDLLEEVESYELTLRHHAGQAGLTLEDITKKTPG